MSIYRCKTSAFEDWKYYIICIYKGGNKVNMSNYQTVVLTSHIIKIFQKFIIDHLVQNNLNPGHGFRESCSCLSQLRTHYDTILSFVKNGSNVDTINLDFSKVFDKVDHSILVAKLKQTTN